MVPPRTFRSIHIYLLSATLILGCAAPGTGRGSGDVLSGFSERIEFDLLLSLFRVRNSDEYQLHVHLSFPRSKLQFLRDESRGIPGWRAEYEWSVIVRERRGLQVGGGVYFCEVVLEEGHPEYPTEVLSDHQLIDIPLGRYWVEVTLSDRNSIRRGRRVEEIEAFAFHPDQPGLSQIEVLKPGVALITLINDDLMFDPGSHLEEVEASSATDEEAGEVSFLFEAYNIPDECEVVYRLFSGGEEVGSRKRDLPSGISIVVRDTLCTGTLEDGRYTLEVSVEGIGSTSLREERVVRIRRPLLARGDDLEETLTQMNLYASEEIVEMLGGLPRDLRRAFLDSLWKTKDPTPSTERNEVLIEFNRRLRHADDRWRLGPLRGWDVDIGRIYIAYGEPDEIADERAVRTARSPLDQNQQVMLRKWIYRDPPVTFVFEYQQGRGWILLRDVSSPIPPVSATEYLHNYDG